MSVRERLHVLIEELSENDLLAIERMVRHRQLPEDTALSEEERLAHIDAVWGKYADSLTPVDEFLARKQEEKRREDARDQRRQVCAG